MTWSNLLVVLRTTPSRHEIAFETLKECDIIVLKRDTGICLKIKRNILPRWRQILLLLVVVDGHFPLARKAQKFHEKRILELVASAHIYQLFILIL